MNKLQEFYTEYMEEMQILGLSDDSDSFVYGHGDPDSPVVMIGEAPGAEEVKAGVPFVGSAGRNLNSRLEAGGISRNQIYVTNAIKYRLAEVNPKTGRLRNRPATAADIRANSRWLRMEMEMLKPKLIITLGRVPLKCLLPDQNYQMSDIHGKEIETEFGTVIPLYHPASIIYNRELTEVFDADFENMLNIARERTGK
ncbi:MAG: uracil-DNA glycosylase [Clostridia bacterium]|nr:uracil-DNA glycosylase [Clostridia bacterium]